MEETAAPTEPTESPPEETPAAEAPPPAAPEPPPIVTAHAWRRFTRRRYRVYLPSHAVVIARRMDSATLLLDGILDQEQALKLLAPAENPEELKGRVSVCRRAACAIVAEPPVVAVDDPRALDPDVMTSEDVPPADALALVAWALGVPTNAVGEPLDDVEE